MTRSTFSYPTPELFSTRASFNFPYTKLDNKKQAHQNSNGYRKFTHRYKEGYC